MMGSPENVTTWRDLADQLTPGQVAELEYCEREQVPPGLASAGGHLNYARKLAELNIARAVLADVAAPVDAVEIDEWTDWDDGLYQRDFTSWVHSGCEVALRGFQFSDGRTERYIWCGGCDELTADDARQLAVALVEAADTIDRLEGRR